MASETAQVLLGTEPLTLDRDLAVEVVEALDRSVTETTFRFLHRYLDWPEP